MTVQPSSGGTSIANRVGRQVARVAVVDIGSNSVRLVIIDDIAGAAHHFFNEKVTCQLGKEIVQTGKLYPPGKTLALQSLQRFTQLIKNSHVAEVYCVATAAVREAEDGADFCQRVTQSTGLAVQVISGEEEAELSALGVIWSMQRPEGIVCDIGGSSMELALVKNNQVQSRCSTGLGASRMAALGGDKAFIDQALKSARATLDHHGENFYLVGGSWRALLKVDVARSGYPLSVLHNYAATSERLRKTIELVRSISDTNELVQFSNISPSRIALLPHVLPVLEGIIEHFQPAIFYGSVYGLREGVAVANARVDLESDPLLRCAKAHEADLARFSGFGQQMYDYLEPVFQDFSPALRRLAHAACLLHDVCWQAHPEFRLEACFQWPLQANLIGATHEDRLFLAVAMSKRYKSARAQNFKPMAMQFMDEKHYRLAVLVGSALRFATMLSVGDSHSMGQLSRDDSRLILTLQGNQGLVFNNKVRNRLGAVATALNLKPVVINQ